MSNRAVRDAQAFAADTAKCPNNVTLERDHYSVGDDRIPEGTRVAIVPNERGSSDEVVTIRVLEAGWTPNPSDHLVGMAFEVSMVIAGVEGRSYARRYTHGDSHDWC